jgi:hypothetical protein
LELSPEVACGSGAAFSMDIGSLCDVGGAAQLYVRRKKGVYSMSMGVMNLRIEAASAKLMRSQYGELFHALDRADIRYDIVEEPVGFGPEQDLILVGLVFVWESIKSGVTWDIIRSQILKVLGMLEPQKLKKVSVYIESVRPKLRYEIECTYKNEDIELKLPDGTHLAIRQNKAND